MSVLAALEYGTVQAKSRRGAIALADLLLSEGTTWPGEPDAVSTIVVWRDKPTRRWYATVSLLRGYGQPEVKA